MKRAWSFAPREADCGAALGAVRRIAAEWADVEWFTPREDPLGRVRAVAHFAEHHAICATHAPELFPPDISIQTASGDWEEFRALCDRLRYPAMTTWDWKCSALKPLTRAHSKARGWAIPADAVQAPGALFFRYQGVALWSFPRPAGLAFDDLSTKQREAVEWYMSFVDIDFQEFLEWQLAEGHDDVSGNPFVPLLRCYATGHYPFILGKAEAVLFAFER
jgi:hypothetical protein